MTTHVDELTSEISVEPQPAPGPGVAASSEWQIAAELRERLRRLAEERRRTAAEGFDD